MAEIEDAGLSRTSRPTSKSMTMSQLREMLRGAHSDTKLSLAVVLGLLDCVEPEVSAETDTSWQETNPDFTPAEFGKIMHRSSVTVAQWCAGGQVPGAYKLQGRAWRIPRASVQRFRDLQALPRPKIALSSLVLHRGRRGVCLPSSPKGRSV